MNVLRRTATDRLLIPDVTVVEAAAMQRAGLSLHPEDVVEPSNRTIKRFGRRDDEASCLNAVDVSEIWMSDDHSTPPPT